MSKKGTYKVNRIKYSVTDKIRLGELNYCQNMIIEYMNRRHERNEDIKYKDENLQDLHNYIQWQKHNLYLKAKSNESKKDMGELQLTETKMEHLWE